MCHLVFRRLITAGMNEFLNLLKFESGQNISNNSSFPSGWLGSPKRDLTFFKHLKCDCSIQLQQDTFENLISDVVSCRIQEK